MSVHRKADNPQPVLSRVFTAAGLVLATCFVALSPITAEDNPAPQQPSEPVTNDDSSPRVSDNTVIPLEDGGSVTIDISEAMVTYIPDEQASAKSTAESITMAIMQNPELAEVFVPGLFEAPAAGGPEYDQNQQAASLEKNASGYDPKKASLLETSLAAALLFRQTIDIRIIPDIPLPNANDAIITNTPRP